MTIKGYFYDSNGIIYTIADFYEGGCNAPYRVFVEGNTVLRCGEYSEDDGLPINDEYTLWSTLSELAACIESD